MNTDFISIPARPIIHNFGWIPRPKFSVFLEPVAPGGPKQYVLLCKMGDHVARATIPEHMGLQDHKEEMFESLFLQGCRAHYRREKDPWTTPT